VLDAIDKEIGTDEQLIRQEGKADRAAEILASLPGLGLILANMIAAATDGIAGSAARSGTRATAASPRRSTVPAARPTWAT